MFIQALPSTGKSTVTNTYPGRFVDSDGILSLLTGDISADAHAMLFADRDLLRRAKVIINDMVSEGVTILSNWSHPDIKVDYVVGYEPDAYIEHIRLSGRTDLIDGFGEAVLREWAGPFKQQFDGLVALAADEYLEDFLKSKGLV